VFRPTRSKENNAMSMPTNGHHYNVEHLPLLLKGNSAKQGSDWKRGKEFLASE